MKTKTLSARKSLALVAIAALSLAACSSNSSQGGASGGGAGDEVTLSILVDNSEIMVSRTEALIKGFEAANPGIKVDLETRPQGSDGDNMIKTRLATGEMTDLIQYNSGSLLAQISPEQFLEPVTGAEFFKNVSESFPQVVTVNGEVYGAPFVATSDAGGVLYNKKVYAELGLSVPTTWDEYMANAEAAKAAGKAGIIQSLGETWTSQITLLGDFHNVLANDPTFAENYTANKAKFADHPQAIRGFEKTQEMFDRGLLNEDYAAINLAQGLEKLASGEGAHYPALTFVFSSIPEEAQGDIGFFPIPGDDAATNGMTAWISDGVFINKASKHKEEALKFLEYVTTPESCEDRASAVAITGPWTILGCEIPEGAPGIVADMLKFSEAGAESPALEYLSPIKGPALEQILIEVASGLAPAADAAARYDADVTKQAKQLGLEGW